MAVSALALARGTPALTRREGPHHAAPRGSRPPRAASERGRPRPACTRRSRRVRRQRGQDADHGVDAVVHLEPPSDHAGVAPEPVRQKSWRQQEYRFGPAGPRRCCESHGPATGFTPRTSKKFQETTPVVTRSGSTPPSRVKVMEWYSTTPSRVSLPAAVVDHLERRKAQVLDARGRRLLPKATSCSPGRRAAAAGGRRSRR